MYAKLNSECCQDIITDTYEWLDFGVVRVVLLGVSLSGTRFAKRDLRTGPWVFFSLRRYCWPVKSPAQAPDIRRILSQSNFCHSIKGGVLMPCLCEGHGCSARATRTSRFWPSIESSRHRMVCFGPYVSLGCWFCITMVYDKECQSKYYIRGSPELSALLLQECQSILLARVTHIRYQLPLLTASTSDMSMIVVGTQTNSFHWHAKRDDVRNDMSSMCMATASNLNPLMQELIRGLGPSKTEPIVRYNS